MIFTHSEDRINFKELNIVLNYNEPGRNNPEHPKIISNSLVE